MHVYRYSQTLQQLKIKPPPSVECVHPTECSLPAALERMVMRYIPDFRINPIPRPEFPAKRNSLPVAEVARIRTTPRCRHADSSTPFCAASIRVSDTSLLAVHIHPIAVPA